MRIVLVGHGKMGRMIESLAGEYDCDIAGVIDPQSPAHGGDAGADRWRDVDVAVDFTVPDAVVANASVVARRGSSPVIGTTGWKAHERERQAVVAGAGVGEVSGA